MKHEAFQLKYKFMDILLSTFWKSSFINCEDSYFNYNKGYSKINFNTAQVKAIQIKWKLLLVFQWLQQFYILDGEVIVVVVGSVLSEDVCKIVAVVTTDSMLVEVVDMMGVVMATGSELPFQMT